MTLKEEMLVEMKARIERQSHLIKAQWWIIGLLVFLAACLAA